MIRTFLVVVFIVVFLIVACIPHLILLLIGKKNPGLKDQVSRHMIRFAFRMIMLLSGVKCTVEGIENIPADRSVLYISNHRSLLDVVIIYMLFPGVTGFVAKKEMMKFPLLYTWMRNIHCLFLDRENIKDGLKMILAGIEQVNNGISVCIYPEGTRGRSENETDMLPFKEGSMKIAEKSGCPVIPIAMLHTADILEKHFPKIRPTHVYIRVGAPIDLKTLDKEQRKFSGAYVRGVLADMLTDMQNTMVS